MSDLRPLSELRAKILETVDPAMKRVILELASCDDDYRPYVRTLAQDLDMPVEQLRRILHTLGDYGLATYGPVCDTDDGRPKGSTWWLTERGIALREELGR